MFLFEMSNLGEGFKKYFEILPALTPELKDEVFQSGITSTARS
jgi:hypothetical protein